MFLVVLLIALALACEKPAAAYTDPGSGTLALQLLASVFIGALFYIRRFTLRLKKEKRPKD
jgi:hypothetical protein